MATLYRNRQLFSFLLVVVGLTLFSSVGQAQTNHNTKEACFRLEGVMMPCSGGGGCGEQCDAARQATLCRTGPSGSGSPGQSYQICGDLGPGARNCAGTKCCETCQGMAGRFDKCTKVKACGQTCANFGTREGPDCSKSSCTHWVLGPGTVYEQDCWWEEGTGPDRYTCTGQCQGDGCSKTCRLSGNQCQPVGNCSCNTSCQRGVIPGQNYRRRKCNAKVAKSVQCWSRSTKPRVSDGNCGCKCPSDAVTSPTGSEPRCGTTTTNEIPAPDQQVMSVDPNSTPPQAQFSF